MKINLAFFILQYQSKYRKEIILSLNNLNNEKYTRIQIIDNRLKNAGWLVGDLSQVVEELGIVVNESLVKEATTLYSGHQYSDYVLLGMDGKPLAVVDAKKTSVDAAIGREQAKKYCYNIQKTKGGELINTKIAGRYYQISSTRAVYVFKLKCTKE